MESRSTVTAMKEDVRRRSFGRFLGLSARIVLEAAIDVEKKLGHAVGRMKLEDFLTGKESMFMRANGLNGLPLYGVFAHFRKKWITRLIEILRENGYFVVAGEFRPVLMLSEESEELMKNPEELPILPGEILNDPVVGSSRPNSAMEQKLRAIRIRLAQVIGMPPKQVMSDQLVRTFCLNMPKNRDEMEDRLSTHAKQHCGEIWEVLQGEETEKVS